MIDSENTADDGSQDVILSGGFVANGQQTVGFESFDAYTALNASGMATVLVDQSAEVMLA